jgi:hypothetical protein
MNISIEFTQPPFPLPPTAIMGLNGPPRRLGAVAGALLLALVLLGGGGGGGQQGAAAAAATTTTKGAKSSGWQKVRVHCVHLV